MASACSSSNHAIGQAFAMVRSGQVDAAVAGGADATLTLGLLRAWEAMRVVSADTCRPFSANRTGMILGEGAAIRYTVAVGRPGKQWQGKARVSGKYVRPAWTPPAEVKADNPALPDVIPGGAPNNPRDALAEEIAAAEAEVGAAVRPDLLEAFGAAERAVFAAEAEMKDAEHALAVAGEPPLPGPGSSTPTNP